MSGAALVVVFALAQAAAPAPKATPAPAPSPARTEAAPFEGDLLRLSEVMGSLAYLRGVCRDGDGDRYREEVQRLIAADARGEEQKDQLAGAFNRGFDGYRLTYRICTANARAAISSYLDEAGRLSHDLAQRFGG